MQCAAPEMHPQSLGGSCRPIETPQTDHRQNAIDAKQKNDTTKLRAGLAWIRVPYEPSIDHLYEGRFATIDCETSMIEKKRLLLGGLTRRGAVER